MKLMTATEVARAFATVLDRAAHRKTGLITRRWLALLVPAPAPPSAGNGAALKDVLARSPLDEDFAADVVAARIVAEDKMSGTWHDD